MTVESFFTQREKKRTPGFLERNLEIAIANPETIGAKPLSKSQTEEISVRHGILSPDQRAARDAQAKILKQKIRELEQGTAR